MAQNSTSLCLFNTLGNIYKAIQTTNLSVEEIVNLCPDVCTLAYGDGNPDLSGRGMMSSYILDVAFTLLCGPAYTLISRYYKLTTNDEVRKHFFEAQGLFTVPVLVAAIVRIEECPPLFEIAFLQYLNWTLAFSFYATLLSSFRKRSMLIYTCCIVVLQITIFARSGSQKVIPMSARQIIDYCTQHSATAPQYVGQDWRLQVVVTCVVIGVAAVVPAISYASSQFKRVHWKLVLQIYGICCMCMALYGVTQLFSIRKAMRNATGSAFTDDQWGFGQVAAVFIWVPWAVQSAEHIYRLRKPKQDSSLSNDGQTNSSVNSMSEMANPQP